MRSVPVPCTNCLRFHYNKCFQSPRQCWKCGQYGHIERFCPTRARLRVEIRRGEPLPGTHRWCEMFGLNDDPNLKKNVLMALKMSPGSSITIDGRCIYRGGETHFTTRRSTLKYSQTPEIRGRSRSRSPSRQHLRGQQVRSRSPLRRYSPERSRDPYINGRYRYNEPSSRNLYPQYSPYRANDGFHDRTTISRTASPVRDRSRSPRYASGSNVIVFTPQTQEQHRSMLPERLSLPAANLSQLLVAPPQTLSETTTNLPFQTLAAASEPPVTSTRIKDPHFVLGISEGASEVEVLDAFQQRMWELQLERKSDDDNYIWDESVRILKEARRILTGS